MELLGYQIIEKLAESRDRAVYSAVRNIDQQPVVLKVLRSEHPNPDMIALVYHEYDVSKNLDFPGIIKIYTLIEERNQYVLVQEDMQGISLKVYLKENPINNVRLFLKLAVQMARILNYLHQQHIIHKDIKPENFIIHPETLELKLTDFNFSTKLLHEVQGIVPPNKLEGTLAYMAPEQTGRMNMNIDYRVDFYALGVTFFEMITGGLPYVFLDPLELLHAHLTIPAPDLSAKQKNYPPILAKIIQKLMEKNPQVRYQSAAGLLADLEFCEKCFERDGKIDSFPLGQHEVFDRLNLSQKLYGREKETKILLGVYDRVRQGAVEGIMICGYAGIGKTKLIHEVHKAMVKQKGYFISGKFDQLQRNTPFTAITQAFNQWARYILAESEERFESIKNSIQKALGGVAQIIIDLAPDIELIIGPQPKLEVLPPRESQNRMMLTFKHFLQAIASNDHPLVVFIDDLQWVDSGSLKLLEYLMTDEELSHVLLIGAFRDNECDEYHPLKQFLKDLNEQGKKINILSLNPLTTIDFDYLFIDTFNRKREDVQDLAEFIHKRTGGNPFFALQVINKIYKENLLYFNYDRRQWEWNLSEVLLLKITDNVVDFMLTKIDQFSGETNFMLKLASCIGNRFTLQTLILISGLSSEVVVKNLWPALQEELIITIRLGHKRMEAVTHENLSALLSREIICQFVHDHVQQAVYQGISNNEKKKVHLSIARLLIQKEPEASKNTRLFEVVDHFNHAQELLNEDEKIQVTCLNYQAGLQALHANAYPQMSNYLRSGLDLTDKNWWDSHYELMFGLSRAYAQSQYLTGALEEAALLAQNLLDCAKNDFDRASIYRILCLHLQSQGNMPEALIAGFKALELLGVKIPQKPSRLKVIAKLIQIKFAIRKHKIETLDKELKTLTDPKIIAVSEILNDMFYLIYWVPGNLYLYVPLVSFILMLRYGKPKNAGLWVTMYSVAMLYLSKNVDLCFSLWALAERLMEEETDKYSSSVSYGFHAYWFNHLRFPFRDGRFYLQKGAQYALESGNLIAAATNMTAINLNIIAESKSLAELNENIGIALKYCQKARIKDRIDWMKLLQSIAAGLMGTDISIETQRSFYQAMLKSKNTMLRDLSSVVMGSYYFFIEHYVEACECHFLWYVDKRIHYAILGFFERTIDALSIVKCMPNLPYLIRRRYHRRFLEIFNEIKWAANECPYNYWHQYLILYAVRANLKGNFEEAVRLFDEAAEKAKKGDFYLWVALANELAGDLLMDRKLPNAAMYYIREAHYYYGRFGMGVKLKLLENRYPRCFADQTEITTDLTNTGRFPIYESRSRTSLGLDYMSVIKASQAISGEIVLDKLFESILHIVLENAGAQKAFFLENDKKTWMIIAKLSGEQGQEKFEMLNVPLKGFENLPQNLIQYSLRAEEAVVLSDASENHQYVQDPYILKTHPKSILSLPLLHQNKVVGLIYLENNLTTGAFTQGRITLLTTLASQVAISLQNARHFDEMQSLYKSTERFVPKQFLEILNRSTIQEIKLGDCLRLNISVLFSDIRKFTTILEKLDPDAAFAFVNRFWAVIAPVIRKNQGFINQYQGDGVLALFVGGADDAVAAGIEMHKTLLAFNQEQLKIHAQALEIGVGINSGPAMIGIIGEEERLEPAVVSDIANTASRIETLNKTYGTHFLISDDTFNALKNTDKFVSRVIDKVRLKGKTITTYLYEIIDWESELQNISLKDYLELFSQVLSYYEKGNFASAKEGLMSCLNYRSNDHVAQLLCERCEEFLKHGTPPEWDGVYTLTHK